MSSGIPALDQILGTDGYPDGSVVLVVSPPGIAKEVLGYWFTHAGLVQNDFCLHITKLSVKDVLRDAMVFGIDYSERVPLWMASYGGQLKLDVNDLAGLSFSIKDAVAKNAERRLRIVIDALSPILLLNQPEAVYRFLSQLFLELKQRDAVLLATLEDGMHPQQVVAAMEQLFDGVVELKLFEEGMQAKPLLRVLKMRGSQPQPGYFNFAFTSQGMEVSAFAK
ncbi:MAG TPA: RAD55 family ATPase [Nitrososphaerales archaeon]|nr:RAD55 family ATPase [Nitrososphaerales archaeon]